MSQPHQQKLPEPLEVNILLPVEDIYKIVYRKRKMRSKKVSLSLFYLFLTIQILNSLFILLIAYLRPTLITNTYTCFDKNTLTNIKCSTKSTCACGTSKCVSFCYQDSYDKCSEQFRAYSEDDEDSTIFTNEQGRTFIKYNIENKENLSLFQKIGDQFCNEHLYLILFIGLFSIGGFIGYFTFGSIGERYGKVRGIQIMSIGVILSMVPISVICNFEIKDHTWIYSILWAAFLFFTGVFLRPLETSIYVYYLELTPRTDFLKPLNGLLYERYFFSLLLYYLLNQYAKTLIYYFYFFEAYMIIFVILFSMFYLETPRFYSERDDFENKKKSLLNYMNEEVIFIVGVNENEQFSKSDKAKISSSKSINKRNQFPIKKDFTLVELKAKLANNIRLDKKNFLVLICFTSLSIAFYIVLISEIFDMVNPNTLVKESTKRGVLVYLIVIFPLLQLPSYFCYKLVDLDKYIMFFLFVLCFIPFNYDLGNMKYNSDETDFFGTFAMLKIKNKHPYIQASSLWIITFVVSIFEMLAMLQPPTLYRTLYYYRFKGVTHILIFLAYFANYYLEGQLICVSIIAFCTGLLFAVMRVRWKFDSFEENVTRED